MLDPMFQWLPRNSRTILDNVTCAYCSTSLDAWFTKDHVIARKFVPRGELAGQWNLIVRACKDCNRRKGNLEDDISAISLQPDAWGRHATPDQVLAIEAARKASSKSHRTGKAVKDSAEQLTITVPLAPGVSLTAHMTCPPQVDSTRVYELGVSA